MNLPKRTTVVRVVVALAVVAGVVVVARMVFGCTPPRDQAKMVELFEADPLSAVAPDDGELVEKWSHTYWCDSGMRHGSSPTGPGFAEVKRLYQTPTAYSVDQLRQLFDVSAAAAGWTYTSRPDVEGYGLVTYAKRIGCRSVSAMVSSSAAVISDDGGKMSPGIDLILSASPECGASAGGG